MSRRTKCPRQHRCALVLALAAALSSTSTLGAEQDRRKPDDDSRTRLELSVLGLHQWDALGELRAAKTGEFESIGAGTGASFHWRVRDWSRGHVLAGVDAFISGSDTTIRHNRDNLLVRGFQLTPSVKLVFEHGNGPRFSLDAGLGFYEVDISEVGTFWFGEDAEYALWRESALGGYVGATVEFTDRQRTRPVGFFVAAKVHSLDLGAVTYQGPAGFDFGTLGPGAGALQGPVFSIQIGLYLRR